MTTALRTAGGLFALGLIAAPVWWGASWAMVAVFGGLGILVFYGTWIVAADMDLQRQWHSHCELDGFEAWGSTAEAAERLLYAHWAEAHPEHPLEGDVTGPR